MIENLEISILLQNENERQETKGKVQARKEEQEEEEAGKSFSTLREKIGKKIREIDEQKKRKENQ